MAEIEPLGSIVVATDFSEGARKALERAALLPLAIGASIELLHVLDEDRPAHADVEAWMEQARQSMLRALEAATGEEHTVRVSIERGTPFVEIARSAHHGRADLIVLGRHGQRSFRDKVLGTTAERVIRNGDVSTLVVVEPAEAPYRQPLVAVDLSESSRRALELAVKLHTGGENAIDALHVITLPAHLAQAGVEPELIRLEPDLERSVRSELVAFLGSIEPQPRKWNMALRVGDPCELILREARRRRSDLTLLGTKGRTGLAHVLVGSVAEGVLRAATGDVLVARLARADFRLP